MTDKRLTRDGSPGVGLVHLVEPGVRFLTALYGGPGGVALGPRQVVVQVDEGHEHVVDGVGDDDVVVDGHHPADDAHRKPNACDKDNA